ncbi:MAG TPA: hypothetical protein VFA78_09620 [Chloroflexota bacterium]|nr:hypothetical protein [Chloroflexota bacterium]
MTNPRAIHIKARAVVRELGHTDGDALREYEDYHIAVRAGGNYITIWASSRMVFLSMAGVPVYHLPGPWEQYLDRLFQRTGS